MNRTELFRLTDGKYLYATLEYPGQVMSVSLHPTGPSMQRGDVGSMVRGIALSPDGQSLFVSEYLTAKLMQIDVSDGR